MELLNLVLFKVFQVIIIMPKEAVDFDLEVGSFVANAAQK
jgi:hypothetical protein